MLAHEYANTNKTLKQPVILGNVMIPGLKKGQYKMSKSDPDSAIFMEDSEAEVKRKIMRSAYCKAGVVEENPCLDWFRYFILDYYGQWEMVRSEADGGNKIYTNIEEVNADWIALKLHPNDLKANMVKGLNDILAPVRKHFEVNPEARRLFGKVKEYQAMREKESRK